MPIKTTRKLLLSQPTVAAALIIAFCLVVGTALLSALSTREVSAATQRSALAQQSLVAINRLLATVSEAETGQRGYLLTRDEKYLVPYDAARTRLPVEFATLRELFEGRPDAAARLEKLEDLTDAKLGELARALTLLRDHGMAPALNFVESDRGWLLMNEIRQSLQVLQTQQLTDLTHYANLATERVANVQKVNLSLIGLAAVLALAGGFMVVRRMHDLEALITVCSWTRRVKWEGRWLSFEEYLQARFNLQCTHGISEEAAEKFRQQLENEPVPEEVDVKSVV
jgi:CHASE3 domain sensor protein